MKLMSIENVFDDDDVDEENRIFPFCFLVSFFRLTAALSFFVLRRFGCASYRMRHVLSPIDEELRRTRRTKRAEKEASRIIAFRNECFFFFSFFRPPPPPLTFLLFSSQLSNQPTNQPRQRLHVRARVARVRRRLQRPRVAEAQLGGLVQAYVSCSFNFFLTMIFRSSCRFDPLSLSQPQQTKNKTHKKNPTTTNNKQAPCAGSTSSRTRSSARRPSPRPGRGA